MGGGCVWSESAGAGTEPPVYFALENSVGGKGQPFKLWRTTHGAGVVPWGTNSMSHRYRYLISLITFRCPFSVLTFFPSYSLFPGPLSILSFPCFPRLASCSPARRLVVSHFPSVLSNLPFLSTSSHRPIHSIPFHSARTSPKRIVSCRGIEN